MNGSVADRGSCAMIGLRICAFSLFFPLSPPPLSRDSKVTKIYNQMAYDTLARKGSGEAERGVWGGRRLRRDVFDLTLLAVTGRSRCLLVLDAR